MKALDGWENFYVIVGSSAGALIGLQFVVLTLIAGRPIERGEAQASNALDRKSTRLNSSYANISYAVFCLKKKKNWTWRCFATAAQVSVNATAAAERIVAAEALHCAHPDSNSERISRHPRVRHT